MLLERVVLILTGVVGVSVGGVYGQVPVPFLDVVIQVSGPPSSQAMAEANNYQVDLLLAKLNSDDDNDITPAELDAFVASLDNNNNGNIERCELVNYYSTVFNASAEAASFLYNAFNNDSNNLSNGTDIFAYNELSLMPGYQDPVPLVECRRQMLLAVYYSGFLAYEHRDVIIATDMDALPPSGDTRAAFVDANDDGMVSSEEFTTAFFTMDADGDGSVSRCEFERTEAGVGFDSTAIDLVFDTIDNDSDNELSRGELVAEWLRADTIVVDQKVTNEEYAKHLDRGEWLARRQVGVPVRPMNYSCDWMNNTLPFATPTFDVFLWVADADDDVDGVITQQEYYAVVDTYYEKNRNGNLSRCEFNTRTPARYGVNTRQTNAIYDAFDTNRDDEVTPEDIDVTVADYNDDGTTTTCELLLYMTYVTSQAEEFAARRARELVAERDRLYNQAVHRQQRRSNMADPDVILHALSNGDKHQNIDVWLYKLFRKWMAYCKSC